VPDKRTAPVPAPSGLRYHERLSVPLAWWMLSGLFAISMLLAFGLTVGPAWGIGLALLSFVAVAAVFGAASIAITVSDTELRVGRANIELRYLGDVRPLDAAAARLRRGPQADARAYLVLRPYLATAVEIALADDDDPVPYWLVATRKPRVLAAALAEATAATLSR
jgi:hypothetical protein